jgi:hypothetical protein
MSIKKRGQMTVFGIIAIFIIFFAVIALIVIGIATKYYKSAFDLDIDAGNVNLREVSTATIGQFHLMVFNNADFWGICIIFGLVMGLFLSSYLLRGKFPKIGVLLDIGIIFITFITSLYIRVVYQEVVIALSAAGEDFAQVYLPKTSFFILNLPVFVAIIGVIAMVLFHSGIPPKIEEQDYIPQVTTG